MKTYLALCLSAACALMMSSSQAHAKPATPSVRILPIAEIQPEDLAEYRKHKMPWFAVYPYQTVPTQPIFKKSMSSEPAYADNLMVHSGQKREPLFLMSGLKPLSEPATIFFSLDGMTIREDDIVLSAPNPSDNGSVRLFVRKPTLQQKISPHHDDEIEVVLRDGTSEKTQVLDTGNTSLTYDLQWAGDLDGDQKLDLFIVMTESSSARRYELWLSSRAEPNTLVKKVAEFYTLGC